MHWLYGKSRIPSSGVKVLTPLELFCKRKPDVSQLHPFGCLAYMHLQKDQHPALTPHTAQCVLVGYPWDYKGWSFYNPHTHKTIISDSAVFHKSVFPFCKTGFVMKVTFTSIFHPFFLTFSIPLPLRGGKLPTKRPYCGIPGHYGLLGLPGQHGLHGLLGITKTMMSTMTTGLLTHAAIQYASLYSVAFCGQPY